MNRNDRFSNHAFYTYVRRTLGDVMDEIARLSTDVHKVKKRQQRARSVQRKKEPNILQYKSPSLIDRRLEELKNIHKNRALWIDKSR